MQGITVLDMTRYIPGAFCTLLLADLGAEIIKVEDPKGTDIDRLVPPLIGNVSSRYLLLNRGKKSVALNLKETDGRDILCRMVQRADVLIESFRPGVMKRLGLDYESLKKFNDKLVYCSISSFGQDGPCSDAVAHDLNILGMTGICSATGTKKGEPVIPVIQIVDSVSGMYAALAILTGLQSRGQTGQGRFIDISMYDSTLSLVFELAKYTAAGLQVPAMGYGRLSGGSPFYNIYKTKDGKFITVAAIEKKFRDTFYETIGLNTIEEKYGGASLNEAEDNNLKIKRIQKIFLKKTRDEWMRKLGPLNICIFPILSIEETLSHSQTKARNMVLTEKDQILGFTMDLGAILKSGEKRFKTEKNKAPGLGEHTRYELLKSGLNKNDIKKLIKRGIIR